MEGAKKEVSEQVFEIKVTGLNWNATVLDIKEFFSGFTTVKWVKLLKDEQFRSKGIAYIELADQQALDNALKMNKCDFQERFLIIQQAQARKPRTERVERVEREDRPPRRNYNNERNNNTERNYNSDRNYQRNVGERKNDRPQRPRGERQEGERPERKERTERPRQERVETEHSIYVGNLSFETTEEGLKTYFQSFGTVVSTRIIRDRAGKSKGFGYVQFENDQVVGKSLVKNGQELDGRALKVDVSSKKSDRN